MKKLTVIDFFCGAGGFSEGFRQQGFEIIQGYDNWKPAIDTFRRIRDDKSLGEVIRFERNAAGKVTKMWQHSNYSEKLK